VSFQKTNGRGGGDYYEMEFKAEVELLEDCWFDNKDVSTGFFSVIVKRNNEITEHMRSWMYQRRKGEKIKVFGSFDFTKTEKGWRR
jgi:hypothetical protein